jgi:hypothetical protein
MNNVGYVGYKYKPNTIGFPPAGGVTLATGGTLAPITLAVDVVLAAVPFIIAAINRGKPNPNDWQGWNELDGKNRFPIGTNAVAWIINDGQSIQNEALNILQYIKNYGYGNVLTYNSHFNRTITANDLANKLRRGGYYNEAEQLLIPPSPVQSITNILSNKNNLLIYGGIALALILLLKK